MKKRRKIVLIAIIILILIIALIMCYFLFWRQNSGKILNKSESNNLSETIENFFEDLKQANTDITKYMATDENTGNTKDSKHMIDDDMLQDWDEMQQEKLRFLLKDLVVENIDLEEYDSERLENGESADVDIIIKIKAWDDYAPMEMLKYMLEEGENEDDANVVDVRTSSSNEKDQIEILKKIEDNIPEKKVKFFLTVYPSKDGGYVLDDIDLLDDIGIIKIYDEYTSILGEITDFSDVKTISEEQLGENQSILLQTIKEYNNMLEKGEFDFESLYTKYSNIKDRYGETDEDELEEIQKYISWYNGLTEDEKEKANELLEKTGKIEYEIYGIYNSYSGELKEVRIACLIRKLVESETEDYYYDFSSRNEEGITYRK